jgi:hypothetical protein
MFMSIKTEKKNTSAIKMDLFKLMNAQIKTACYTPIRLV